MTGTIAEPILGHLQELECGEAHRFSAGAHPDTPRVCCGVYTVWDGSALIYVGHAGRAVDGATGQRRTGLADRLHHHSTGRRSGDQFCVYVADRLVLPALSEADLTDVANGHLLLDDFVYVYVQDRLSYRVTITPDVLVARAVEDAARSGELVAGKPALNPLPALRRPPRTAIAAQIRLRGA
jgi:hypothetical protein